MPPPTGWSMWFGTLLVLLGVLVQFLVVVDYVRFVSVLKRGETPEIKPSYLGIGIALGLCLVGLLMAVYLVANH